MTIIEHVRFLWVELTGTQKLIAAGLALVLAFAAISGWVDSAWSYAKVRKLENQAEKDKRDAAEKLAAAAKIAADIKVRELALEKIEAKRNEKQTEVGRAAENTNSDRGAYERAVRDARPDTPSADELCRELAGLGYPCG
jgi:HAMP domain-containing protein